MNDNVKDFAYYAAQAERQLQFSLGRDDNDQPLLMDDNTKTRHVMRADVYARLACGAPKAERNDTSKHCAGRLEGPNPDLYYRCVKYAHDINEPHQAPNGAIFRD